MRLGLSLAGIGCHGATGRYPGVPAGGDLSFDPMARCARIGERGRFDFLVIAAVGNRDDPRIAPEQEQGHGKLEPLTLLAALAAVTERVGLIPTVSTRFEQPYHLARKLASIDHLSGGRAGWNLATGTSPDEAGNFGHAAAQDADTRHDRAREFLAVVRGLLGSWEADAFPRDRASGVYMDRAKMHRLEHAGRHFKVRGPLDLERPPQGTALPIVTAGTSETAQDLAAEVADMVYGGQPTIEGARAFYASVKARLPRFGRTPESLLVMPGIMPVVVRTQGEADDVRGRLQGVLEPAVGPGMLAINPVPDLRDHETEGREAPMHSPIVGTPARIADAMEAWFTTGAADGFIVQPPSPPEGAEMFVAMVLPELRRRGLFRTEYEGTTLRQNLGLPQTDEARA